MGRGRTSKLDYGREYGDYDFQASSAKKTKKKPSLSEVENEKI